LPVVGDISLSETVHRESSAVARDTRAD
jgi:hypothetical protein